MDLGISCKFPVRARQEGLQCDRCNRWQHRTCQTGVSQAEYRAAVRSGQPIDWVCDPCYFQPIAESTSLEDDLNSTIYPPLVSPIKVTQLFLNQMKL